MKQIKQTKQIKKYCQFSMKQMEKLITEYWKNRNKYIKIKLKPI